MSNFKLEPDQYTYKNALLWGNCKEHLKQVFEKKQTLSGRIVHALISLLEAIPIIGQIASLAEKIFSEPPSNGSKIISATNIVPSTGIVSTIAPQVLNIPSSNIISKTKEPKKGNKNLELLKSSIKEGRIIDQEFIVNCSAEIIKEVGSKDESKARKMINKAYVKQLTEIIKQRQLPIPHFHMLCKNHNKERLILKYEGPICEEIEKRLAILALNNSLNFDKDPNEFMDELHDVFFDCIVEKLKSDNKGQKLFKNKLNKIHISLSNYCLFRKEMKQYKNEILIPLFDLIDELPNKLNKSKFDLKTKLKVRAEKHLDYLLKICEKDKLNLSYVYAFKENLEKEINNMYLYLINEDNWMKKYNCEQIFDYSQYSGGNDDQVLGLGACYAINLKWGKMLAKLGTRKLKSLESYNKLEDDLPQSTTLNEQFNMNLLQKNKEHQKSSTSEGDDDWNEVNIKKLPENYLHDDSRDNVKSRERFIQARFVLGKFLKSSPELGDGSFKETDFEKYVNLDTVGVILRNINDTHQFDPFGFLSLGIGNLYEPEKGEAHAIGCKIDHEARLYRFWDPNEGIFEIKPASENAPPNFDDFCNAFTAFIEQKYEGWKTIKACEVYKSK